MSDEKIIRVIDLPTKTIADSTDKVLIDNPTDGTHLILATNLPISTSTQTALNQKANLSDLTSHTLNTLNPHNVTKAQIGLGNVQNVDTTTTSNITDSAGKRFVNDTQKTILQNTSGTNSGDETVSTTLATGGVLITIGRNPNFFYKFEGTSAQYTAGVNASTIPTTALCIITDDEAPLSTANISDSLNKRFTTDDELDAVKRLIYNNGVCSEASTETTLTGTVTATRNSASVTGSSTLFTTECPAGSTIVINGTPCLVASVQSNTALTLANSYNHITGTYTATKANNAKTVTIGSGISVDGQKINVTFANKNLGCTPTLNYNSEGAYPIIDQNGNACSDLRAFYVPAGATVEFTRKTINGNHYWAYTNTIVDCNRFGGQCWYRIWSNGFKEQQQAVSVATGTQTVSLLSGGYIDTNYTVMYSHRSMNQTTAANFGMINPLSIDTITVNTGSSSTEVIVYSACGFCK